MTEKSMVAKVKRMAKAAEGRTLTARQAGAVRMALANPHAIAARPELFAEVVEVLGSVGLLVHFADSWLTLADPVLCGRSISDANLRTKVRSETTCETCKAALDRSSSGVRG